MYKVLMQILRALSWMNGKDCFFGSRVICWVPVVCLYNFFCYISLFVLRAEKLKLSKYRATQFPFGSLAKDGNCEEELPKKPVGRLSVNCRTSVDRQVTDSLPTVNQQVTDRLRKKENCGKHEQLT